MYPDADCVPALIGGGTDSALLLRNLRRVYRFLSDAALTLAIWLAFNGSTKKSARELKNHQFAYQADQGIRIELHPFKSIFTSGHKSLPIKQLRINESNNNIHRIKRPFKILCVVLEALSYCGKHWRTTNCKDLRKKALRRKTLHETLWNNKVTWGVAKSGAHLAAIKKTDSR